MKRRLALPLALVITLAVVYFQNDKQRDRSEYIEYINNHPYSEVISQSELESLPKYDRPDLAMRQNFLMTMDPSTGDVPTERLVNAFESLKSSGAKGAQFEAIPDVIWQEKGPNNVGGRTRAVMWDPNDANNEKLWAAGVAGGIWFNNDVTDAASSWQNVDDFMANMAVTTMAYDPTNTQVFYAGTGEGFFNGDAVRGAGIFQSTDGGLNWAQLPSTDNGNFSYVQKVVVTSTGTILAGTRAVGGTSGLYRSTDDGVTFTRMSDISGAVADIEIASNGDLYAGSLSGGTAFRSTDDGLNWTSITPSGSASRIELAVAPSASATTEETIVYVLGELSANVSYFKKSVNGGNTWTDLNIPEYRSQNCTNSGQDFTRGQAWYDLILGVHPTDEDIVFAGGINVLRSDNGGGNMAEVSYWTGGCDTYVHADIHAFAFRPGNPNELVVGSDGGISYSADAGSSSDPTFNDRNNNYNVTQFYAVAAQNTSDVNYYLAGAQDNGTQQFRDDLGFSTNEVTGGDGAFCFIDQDDNNIQISSYIRNVYYRLSSNGGFLGTLSSDQNSGRFINPADYDNTAGILYSAGGSNELKRISGIVSESASANAQETITLALNSEQISALRADAIEPNRLFVGAGTGGVYRIDNADQATPTVTEITGNITTAGYVSSIDLGLTDDEIIVTFSNFGVSSVWYTVDGGANWVNKDNDGSLPDMPVRWALINPNNSSQVMLATELGVWSTNDITADNPAWEQSSNNLANVRCDMLQYRESDKLVVVGTHGRGVFTSNVFGGADTFGPTLSTTTPADDATEVRLDVSLQMSFNEVAVLGTGNIIIEDVTNGGTFEQIDVTGGQVTVASNIATIQTTSDFAPLTEYRVLVDAGAFEDVAGNAYAGLSDNTAWTFTTFDGDEPPVVTTDLENVVVDRNADPITIDLNTYFSDPDEDVISYTIEQNSNPSLVSISESDGELTLTFTTDMAGSSSVTVRATANSKFVESSFEVVVNYAALYTREGTSQGTSPSQIFPDFDNSELETSDSFTVPEGGQWTIYSVSAPGGSNGDFPENALFRIYDDASGEPGTLVYQSDVLPVSYLDDNDDIQINLTTPIELTDGTYWLAILTVQEFAGSTQWFWSYTNGDGYKRRDPDGLLGGAWNSDWEDGVNSSFESDFDLRFTIRGTEPVATPTDLTLSQDESGVLLTWTDNANNEVNYIVERSEGDESSFSMVATLDPDIENFVDDSPATNERNYYRISAVNAESQSSAFEKGNIFTLPAAPVFGDVTDATYEEFTLNWSSADGATDFILDIAEDEAYTIFVDGIQDFSLSTETISITDRLSGTYYCRIAAVNGIGTSPYAELVVVLDPLGVLDGELISVYPNPGNGIYRLRGVSNTTSVSVFDLSGKKIMDYPSGVELIDLTEFQSGSYVLRFKDGNDVVSKTIIKQ